MKNKPLALLFLGLSSLGYAQQQTLVEIPKINMSGGVDFKTACSEISDERACDSSNMINDRLGSAIKRDGSRRYTDIPMSSNPVNSMYKAYITSNTVVRKALLATSWDRIYRSTTDTNPFWVIVASGHAHNQHYNFVTMNNRVLITGDKLINPIISYDPVADSASNLLSYDSSSSSILLRGKYSAVSRNYYILGNVRDVSLSPSTTYYPSRIYYSLLANPSSMTVQRFIDIRTDDGEEITGIAEMFGRVLIFKPSSIHELSFTALNLQGHGGDQALTPLVVGFGCIAPRTLVNTGQYVFFLAKDGVRLYDGGRRSRLTVAEESRVISANVEPIINKIINSGLYESATMSYYPKKQWLVLSYTDPDKFPKRNNSAVVYDIPTGEWFPFKNWNAESFTTMDGPGDFGDLLYGDSTDGYVYWADQPLNQNDARTELQIETCDSTATAPTNVLWLRGATDYVNVQEGTGSVKLSNASGVLHSSVTYMRTLSLGEFPDKSPITGTDKLSIRMFPNGLSNISAIRIDLEINDITPNGDFDSNFTSVTVTSAALVNGNTYFSTLEIALSSFPILADWTAIAIESFPFANAQTFYGLRVDLTSIGDADLSIDDVRVVKATERPLEAFRLTKQFSFNTVAEKRFRQVVLNAEKGADSRLDIDVYTDFGEFSKRIAVPADIPKELIVSGYSSSENVTKLNSVDLSLIESTQANNRAAFSIRPITADQDYIYGGDQYNNLLIKIDRTSMTSVFVATTGGLGSGTSNFHNIYQLAVDDKNLFVCDFGNNRIKVHNKDTLQFVTSWGTLGSGATSQHNPSGIAVDERYAFVGVDGNYRIQKLDKSTGAYITSVRLNENTIGDITLHVDENYLFAAYNVLNATSTNHQDVILEQRNKSDLSLVNRIVVRPSGVVSLSTYALLGDLGGSDTYLYLSFTDNTNAVPTARYYIQKRLKSDLSLVKELKSSRRQFAVAHNGVAYKPKRTNIYGDLESRGTYLQLKYVDSGLDNTMKLFGHSFAIIPEPFKEK